MFYNPAFIGLLGSVPPPATPVTPVIAINPANPGNLGTAPANWTTNVTTIALTQVKWRVGIDGAKTIQFPFNAPSNVSVVGYNHGDTINFTGYGTGFTIAKDTSGANSFFVQGSNGSESVVIGSETKVSDIRYTVDGAGGTGAIAYTLLNLTSNAGTISCVFDRPGDTLIVKSMDEVQSAISGPVTLTVNEVVRSITIFPHAPGNLTTAPASWTTRINAVGINQIQWKVVNSSNVAYATATVVNLTNNTVQITCQFQNPGDKLVVSSIDGLISDTSDPVSFSGVAKTISISPTNPGNLGTAPKNWTTTVTATGLTSVKYAVFNADNTSGMQWITVPITSNTASITATFTTAGQYLAVKSQDDAQQAISGAVSFTATPVVLPPRTLAIQVDPTAPGTIAAAGGVANWDVTVRTLSLTEVEWRIYDSTPTPRSGWNNINNSVLATDTGVALTVPFVATGDFLDVRKVNDWGVYFESTAVTVTTGGTTPAPNISLSLSPQNPTTITQGTSWPVTVTTTGLTSITWVIIGPSPGFAQVGTPAVVSTNGTVGLNIPFTATGQSLRVWNTANSSNVVNSGTVTITTTTTPPAEGVVFVSFDNESTGVMSHIWGDTAVISWPEAGVVKIGGTSLGCGIMEFPAGASAGHGYGLYEMRTKFEGGLGSGSGPANVIWPASDVWPGPEIDIGEISQDGRFYMALHWKGSDGGDAFEYRIKDGLDWNNWHTCGCLFEQDKVTFSIDGVAYATITENVTPDYAHGGENRVMGIMNRSSETALYCDWVRFTPLASIGTVTPTPTASLSFANKTPGTIASGASWTATVNSSNTTSITWVIVGPAPNYTWITSPAVLATTGSVSFAVPFTQTSQFVKVLNTSDYNINIDSDPVTVTGTVTPPTPVPTGNDYQFAYDWIKDLTVGVNMERGVMAGRDQAYFTRLKNDGHITHIRCFPPSRFEWGLVSDQTVGWFLDACQDAIAAGLKVHIDFLDIIDDRDTDSSATLPYLRRCCNQFASRNFDPRKIIVGPANEAVWWQDYTGWQPYRTQYTNEIRNIIGPNFIIVTASGHWGAPDVLVRPETVILSDKRVIYQWHDYAWEAEQLYEAVNRQNSISEWATRNGVVTFNGEYGKNGMNDGSGVNPSWIPQVIDSAAKGMWQQRPTFWAVTDGSYYRMNNNGDHNLKPEMASALRAADSYIRGRPGFGT